MEANSGQRIRQGKAPRQVEGPLPDPLQVGGVLEALDEVRDAVGYLPQLPWAHAAGGDAGRPEAHPAGIDLGAFVEGDRVAVDGDPDRVGHVLDLPPLEAFRPEVDEHQVV